MSAVKHQPATPLPWGPVAKQSPDFEPLPPVRIDYSTDDDGIHFEPQDFAYIHHAAHAYPKLVARTQRSEAWLRSVLAALPEDLKPLYQEAFGAEAASDAALLRDLGEAS